MPKSRSKKKKKVIITVLVIAVIAVIVVLNIVKDRERPVRVETTVVKRAPIVQTVAASGSLQPISQVKISANVSGKIVRLGVKEGEQVKAGDFLVELDRARYEAASERAGSMLNSRKANLLKVKSDYNRIRSLYDRGLASGSEMESAEANYELAISEVEQAEANLKQARDDLDKTRISSPMDGVVTLVKKEVGEIALGSTFQEDVIMVISDMSAMEAEVEVDETDIVNVSIGDTSLIEVDALPDSTFRGVVTDIAHTAETRGFGTQEQITNFPVSIQLIDKVPLIRPGMSTTVDIITDKRDNSIVIPIQSLTARKPKQIEHRETSDEERPPGLTGIPIVRVEPELVEVVFVVKKPEPGAGKSHPVVEQRQVKIGISSDTHFEVISGLDEGEEIVIGGYRAVSKDLKDGTPVETGKTGQGSSSGQ